MSLKIVPHILRAAHSVGVYLDKSGAKVTQAEAHILSHLADRPNATIAQLHAAFGHKRSTLTSVLDRLEARGFVARQLSKDDRRTYLIRLLPSGERAAEEVMKTLRAFEKRVLARLSPAQINGFHSVLDALEEKRK